MADDTFMDRISRVTGPLPTQVSGPDELLEKIDAWLASGFPRARDTAAEIIEECRTRIAANAALAAENAGFKVTLAAAASELPAVAGPIDARIRVYRKEWSERNDALAARCGELQAAIDELVACRKLRDIIDEHAYDYHRAPATDALQEEYERRKPLAWAAARALASQAEGER
jgi:hypothetical protein